MKPWSFRSLTVRLTGTLVLLLALLLALTTWIQLQLQSSYAKKCARAAVQALAESLFGALHTAMMANDRGHLRDSVAQITKRAPNVRVRIFSKDGTIMFSSIPEELGQRLDPSAEACYKCHQQGVPIERLPPGERTREFLWQEEPAVGAIRPIENEEGCSRSSCHAHPPERRLLGVLDVSVKLTQMRVHQQQITLFMVLVTVLALSLVGGVVMAVVHKSVHQPIGQLRKTLEALETGNYSARYEHEDIEDFAVLGRALNRTAQALEQANSELVRWAQTLERRVEEKTAELRLAQEHMVQVERMASLGKLAAVVAHEINNPLASVVTYAKLLLRRLEADPQRFLADPECRSILQSISAEASRCGEIVSNLLLFARRSTARFEPVALNTLVERTIYLLKHKLDMAQVKLVMELDPAVGELICDAGQLQQAVLALAVNAVDAMPGGGTLTIQTRAHDGHVSIVVQDTGVGMDEEVQAHIFEPFFTTKQDSGSKNLGLGLSVVYGIVQRHRGSIQVQSAPGRGATFTMVLPRQPEEASAP
ncbi:MAG: ATP-binding protein [Thermoanaerobaculum sp.]|nr:ATP-binding protein [Thermoanaerobaculum sp.]MDW7968229.1 ATP-binding protein [Thermoanaerobaculum sp.]